MLFADQVSKKKQSLDIAYAKFRGNYIPYILSQGPAFNISFQDYKDQKVNKGGNYPTGNWLQIKNAKQNNTKP